MINGNSVVFQLGKETTYGNAGTASEQVKISSESFKEVYNKIDEGLATGGRGAGLLATMGIGVEGSIATLFRPDMGYLLKGALGVEAVTASTEGKKHTFTAIGNSETDHLPSWTCYVDRKVKKFAYVGCKVNTLSLSAEAGNYLSCEVSFNGKKENVGVTMTSITPSGLRAFKFAQGKAYVGDGEIADITSMSLEINNNLDAQKQTSSTGSFYKEPEVGIREITSNLSMIYSLAAETIREQLYKSDNTFSLKLEFVSDEMIDEEEPYKMTITLPCCQMSDATANMSGMDTLPMDVSVSVADNLSDELITVELINADTTAY